MEGLELMHNPETQFEKSSMVFPPINHENLHRPSKPDQQPQGPLSPSPSLPSLFSSSSESLSSFSPSDSDESVPVSSVPADAQVKRPGEVTAWVGIGVEVLRAKLSAVAASSVFGGFGKVWCFASGAGAAAAVFVLWSLYSRARQRRYRNHLKSIIKEKDEKINKLLHQIAQLNEVLVARHRVLASKLAN